MVAAFDCWELEWPFVERMLRADLRNNSAWAQRAFLLSHRLACRVRAAGGGAAGDDDGGDAAFVQMAAAAAEGLDASLLRERTSGEEQRAAASDATQRGAFECPSPSASADGAAAAARRESSGAAGACDVPHGAVLRCVRNEVDFIARSAARMPHNESAWNHLCGLPSLLSSALAQCGSGADAQDAAPGPQTSPDALDAGILIECRAAAFLAQAPDVVQQDVQAAAQLARQALFDIALDVLKACPPCIPARAALLRAYAAAAAGAAVGSDKQRHAREAAGALAAGLATADPLRRGWYSAVVDGIPTAPP